MKWPWHRKRKPFCADLEEHLRRLPREVQPIIHLNSTLTEESLEQIRQALLRDARRQGFRKQGFL